MIYLAWTLNIFLAIFTAMLIRKLFSNIFLKRFFYAAHLSLFISFWFLYPGSLDLAPILPIYFIEVLESEDFIQMRLIRPMLAVFILIFISDFLVFRYKPKKK